MSSRLRYILVFAVFCIAVASAYVLVTKEYARILDQAAHEELETTETYITGQAKNLLTPGNFTGQGEPQRAAFANFFAAIQSPEIIRMKVWNTEHVVIWSELPEIIGQKFENEELSEVLEEGHAEIELAEEKDEHVSERQYTYLAEMYLPIRNDAGTIVGVLEIYKPGNVIDARVSETWYLMLFCALLGILALTGIAYVLVRRL